tara:strand:+ start:1700 stop:2044 length:345 start_codon:yes stop_codon:yes gene_type:complete
MAFVRTPIKNVSNNSGSPSTLYTVPTAKTSIIIGCLMVNKTATEATINVFIDAKEGAGSDAFLCHTLKVPEFSSVELSLGKVVVTHDATAGDVVKAYASAASTFDLIISVLEGV